VASKYRFDPLTGNLVARSAETSGGPRPFYNRPAQWPAMSDLSAYSQAIEILFAVWDTGQNLCAFQCSGNYTVDWGDGTSSVNVTGGTNAQYNYNYASVPGSPNSLGYKTVKILVTPQSAASLSTFRTNVKHTTDTNTGINSTYGFLDILMKCPNMATLTIGGSTTSNAHTPRLLQQFEMIGGASMTAYPNAFQNCLGLQRVAFVESSEITGSMASCFSGCRALQIVEGLESMDATSTANMFLDCVVFPIAPSFNLKGTCDAMFSGCYALWDITGLDIVDATSTYQMFLNCRGLSEVGDIDCRNSLDCQQMFSGCTSMRLFGNLDARSANGGANIFNGCTSLYQVGDIDLRAQANWTGVFQACNSIRLFGTITSTAATNFTQLFFQCSNLRRAPVFSSTSSVINFTSMFDSCFSVQYIPIYTVGTANVTTMFFNCYSLRAAPALNYSAVTAATDLFRGCRSLSRGITANAPAVSHSYRDGLLSGTELDAIYTALPTATATITVTSNYGTSGDTPSIATAKSWTVTGS